MVKRTTAKKSNSDSKLKQLEIELEAEKNAKLRALADLENLRRRETENRKSWAKLGVVEFLRDFLPSLLELQLGAVHSTDEDLKEVIGKFFKKLAGSGLEKIEPKRGDSVDPEQHEVLMVEKGEAGTVVRVLEPGWKFDKIVLATAKVSAAQA